MTLIAGMCLLLLSAHLLGAVAERLRQPPLLGHMLAGVIVGPTALGWLKPAPGLATASDMAVVFVVISAGLEMRMQQVLDAVRGKGFLALSLGFLIPAAATAAFTWAMGLDLIPSVVIVLCISVTALPVALRILSEFGMLNSDVARVAVTSALLTDLFVLMALGITMAMAQPHGAGGFALAGAQAVGRLAALLLIVAALHFICAKLSITKSRSSSPRPQPSFNRVAILVFLFVLGVGAVAEQLGFHFVIGVFFASLLVTRELIGEMRFASFLRSIELVNVCVFGPLFLAFQGTQFQVSALGQVSLVLGLIGVAIASKVIGGYLAARAQALPPRTAVGVAIVMNARGLMEMVTASIAYRSGLIDQGVFTALLIVGIVTTFLTPPVLTRWLSHERGARKGARPRLQPDDLELEELDSLQTAKGTD